MADKQKDKEDPLLEKLRKWEKAGIRFYMDGAPATSECIEQNCVNEDTLYLPDYVTDREGKIKEIRYNRISLDSPPF